MESHTMEKILMSFVFEHLDTIAVKIDVSFLCDCPAIDHEFRHSFDNVKTKCIVNNRTGARKTQASIWFFAIISCRTDYPLSHFCSLHQDRICYKFRCLSLTWQWKLACERARISAIIVKFMLGISWVKDFTCFYGFNQLWFQIDCSRCII